MKKGDSIDVPKEKAEGNLSMGDSGREQSSRQVKGTASETSLSLSLLQRTLVASRICSTVRTGIHTLTTDKRSTRGHSPNQFLARSMQTSSASTPSPSALNYLGRYYDPSGDLPIPMLMPSTSRDPEVPRLHEIAYLDDVVATGSSQLLVQREINRYGHCAFTPAELATAFTDLVR